MEKIFLLITIFFILPLVYAQKTKNTSSKTNPESAIDYYNRGLSYDDLGQYQRAIEDYNKAIELNPKFAYAYNNKGNIFLQQGSYDLAIEAIEKSLELDDDNAYAYLNLAICNAKKGDKEFCCVALKAAEKPPAI